MRNGYFSYADSPMVLPIPLSKDILRGILVPYHLVFCHKKQENLCVFVFLCEAIWVAGIARVSNVREMLDYLDRFSRD